MIGLDTGYFFRLAEKTDQSIRPLDTAMEEEQDMVVCTITIYELLRHRMRGSLDSIIVDLVLDNRAAFRWAETFYTRNVQDFKRYEGSMEVVFLD